MRHRLIHRAKGTIPIGLIMAGVLCAGTLLSSCDGSEEETSTVTETVTDEASIEQDEAESAIEDEPISSEGIIYYDIDELSKEQQTMLGPMGALVYAYEDAGHVTPSWTISGWGAVSELFNYWGPDYVDGSGQVTGDFNEIRISEGFLKEAASVMFPDYDGSLPTIDASEETAGFQPEEDGYFPYHFSDRGEETDYFSFSQWAKHDDGSCEVTVEAESFMGGVTTYRFTLTPITDTTDPDPIFTYDVVGMEKISEDAAPEEAAADNTYILPDSDTRYYTEEELRSLSADQLRLARNEIYARHGRKFDSEDLQSYFDGQSWYKGTIDPADFSEDMLNDYEKANLQTIEGLENGTPTASAASADSWQGAYINHIDNMEQYGPHHYSLIYLDDNSVPELYVEGADEAEGDQVCTVSGDNQTVEWDLARCCGMGYVPYSGTFYNWYSHMGYNWIEFYKLNNGSFSTIDAEDCEWVNGEDIPEDEFYEKWGSIIDFDSVVHPFDTVYTANEMKDMLNGM